ncbi:LysE family translocator [Bacteroidales bacterium OttesenSCG-928-L03]|nr:LysE family translocator [Bacteroidales bacterium OttesenSCG-928-L03]
MIFLTGFLIGIIVSAPMGPIGIMCIQRTLNKGRWHGFFSGLGAAFSDLLYAGIVCLGMGIVTNFVETNHDILQIAGSLLLLFFGAYTFRSNPTKRLQRPKEGASSYVQDAITAFLLTLSNPLIIFILMGFYAQFGFVSQIHNIYQMILGLTGVFLGALSWWFLITYLVAKLRNVINVRGLGIINKISGSIIMVISVVLIIHVLLAVYQTNGQVVDFLASFIVSFGIFV